MSNITFDLETLGNSSNAPIVQLAAVKFNDQGKITDSLLQYIDLASLQQYDFDIDYETLDWWFKQSDEAIKSVFQYGELQKVSLSRALHNFSVWIGEISRYVYWSHTTFDPPILENAYRKLGKHNPIPFRLHRDIRTLTHFAGKIDVERVGIHHNALDDCIYQAAYIAEGLKRLQRQEA